MENQGKRLLLAVGLALLVILGWNLIFPPDKPDPNPAPGSASATAIVPPTVPGTTPTSATPTPEKPAVTLAPRPPEEKIELAFPGQFTATFSSYGGALKTWKL